MEEVIPFVVYATSGTLAIDAASIPISWLETWRGISAPWVATEPSANLRRSQKAEQSYYSFKPCRWGTQKAFPTCQKHYNFSHSISRKLFGEAIDGKKMDIISGKYDDWVPRWPQVESPTQQDHNIF